MSEEKYTEDMIINNPYVTEEYKRKMEQKRRERLKKVMDPRYRRIHRNVELERGNAVTKNKQYFT